MDDDPRDELEPDCHVPDRAGSDADDHVARYPTRTGKFIRRLVDQPLENPANLPVAR